MAPSGRPDTLAGMKIIQRPATAAVAIALGLVALFASASLLMLRDWGLALAREHQQLRRHRIEHRGDHRRGRHGLPVHRLSGRRAAMAGPQAGRAEEGARHPREDRRRPGATTDRPSAHTGRPRTAVLAAGDRPTFAKHRCADRTSQLIHLSILARAVLKASGALPPAQRCRLAAEVMLGGRAGTPSRQPEVTSATRPRRGLDRNYRTTLQTTTRPT